LYGLLLAELVRNMLRPYGLDALAIQSPKCFPFYCLLLAGSSPAAAGHRLEACATKPHGPYL